MKISTDGMTPMAAGRLNKALGKLYRFRDGVRTLGEQIEREGVQLIEETDAMIDYNRRRFNSMGSNREQDEYIARLKAKRLYWVNGRNVPKIVYDAIKAQMTA